MSPGQCEDSGLWCERGHEAGDNDVAMTSSLEQAVRRRGLS